jgi:hypothetical protein
MRYLLFPQRAGRLSVGPVEARVALPKKVLDAFGFSVRGVRWVRVRSPKAVLRVREVPQGIRLVGQFDWQVRVAPKKVRAGEPITVTVRVEGKGNIEDVALTLPKIDGATLYAKKPHVQERYLNGEYGGSWQREFMLVAEDNLTVPAMTLRYFDPLRKKVETLESPAVAVTVEGSDQRPVRRSVPACRDKEAESMGWVYANLALAFLLGMATMYGLSRFGAKRRTPKSDRSVENDAKRLFARLMPYIAESKEAAEAAERLYETIQKGKSPTKAEAKKIEALLRNL